jgi:GNAT superfamily N-acetyltransferase
MISEDMILRSATLKDIDILVELRCALWQELGEPPADAQIRQVLVDFFRSHIPRPDFRTFVAEIQGEIAAVGTAHLFTRLPHVGNPSGRELYLLNMYTRPPFRNQGLASAIVEKFKEYALEVGAKRIWLNATDQGQKVYTRAGFKPMDNAMVLLL